MKFNKIFKAAKMTSKVAEKLNNQLYRTTYLMQYCMKVKQDKNFDYKKIWEDIEEREKFIKWFTEKMIKEEI